MSPRPTPFHARTAALNRDNAWIARNGFSLPAYFREPSDEAVAARFSAVIGDISWRSHYRIEGARASECVRRLATRDATTLEISAGLKALWLNDAGAVRGAGVFARIAKDEFKIVSAADDSDWIAAAASLFGVNLGDCSGEEAGLALIGPQSLRVLRDAGLEVELASLTFARVGWRGVEITVSRFGEHGGFEVWCRRDDALVTWDRLLKAGESSALKPAGALALDTLDVEAGVARPWRDYVPARDSFTRMPTPKSLSLEKLVEPAHNEFNGYGAWRAASPSRRIICGVEIDGEDPVPFTPLYADGLAVGLTLTSCHSPSLRRAIALAEIDDSAASPGRQLAVAAPLTLWQRTSSMLIARVVGLPFLPSPDPIGP